MIKRTNVIQNIGIHIQVLYMWGIFVFIVLTVQQLRNAALPFRGIATAALVDSFIHYIVVLRNEISKVGKLHETGLSGAWSSL